jgi:HEAT repeats
LGDTDRATAGFSIFTNGFSFRACLIRLLQNGDMHDRRLAALTLGELGPAAEEAIPALLEAADDEDDGVFEMAVWLWSRSTWPKDGEDEVA